MVDEIKAVGGCWMPKGEFYEAIEMGCGSYRDSDDSILRVQSGPGFEDYI